MKVIGKRMKFIPARFWSQLCRNKNNTVVLLGLIAVGLLIVTSGNGSQSREIRDKSIKPIVLNENNVYKTEELYEKKLQDILEDISGAGRVRVKITLQSDNIKEWQSDSRTIKRTNNGSSELTEEEKTILPNQRNDGGSGLLQAEQAPLIRGVVVTSSGADNGAICEILSKTAATLLNLPEHRVLVVLGAP